jgi:hypothetical protein
VLKGREDRGYFAAPIEPKSFIEFQDALQQNHPALPDLSSATILLAENPFDHAAAVSDVEDYPEPVGVLLSDQHQRKSLPSSTASVVDSESSNERKLRMVQSSSDTSGATSDTLYEEEKDKQGGSQEDAAAIDEPAVAEDGTPVNEESPARIGAGYRPPSAQISYAIVQSPPSAETTTPQCVRSLSVTKPSSVWDLESRKFLSDTGEDYTSDSDADVPNSASARPSRSHRRRPTHEDIRQKFRGSHTPDMADVCNSSTSDVSNVKCEASIGKIQDESKEYGASGNTETKDELATTDPPKVIPETHSKLLN